MSDEFKQHLNKKSNRNWVRAALSLRYFKQGFEPFIDQQIRCHHEDILKRIQEKEGIPTLQCDECTSDNLLPYHSKQKKCIQRYRSHCFCSHNQSFSRRHCPNKICSVLYDYIIQAHSTNDPIWINTNPSNWLTNYWELGKCFLNSPGYVDKESAADTDAAGLISIAINDIYIQDRMDSDIDSLAKVKEARNLILHSASFTLEDSEATKYIEEMIHVLQDKKAFTSDVAASNAIQHLNELKTVECHITFEDEQKVRQETLKAMDEMGQDAANKVRSLKKDALDELEEYIQDQKDQIKTLVQEEAKRTKQDSSKDAQHQETQTVAACHIPTMDTITEAINFEPREVKEVKITSLEERNISGYSNDKQQIQAALVDRYKKFYIQTDISPLLPEKQIDVDLIYVPPQLYKTGSIDDYKDSQHDYYNIYGDVKKTRLKESEFLRNIVKRNILITADAGMGKTALCCRMISAWCAAHGNSSPSPDQIRHDSTSLSFRPEEQNTNSWCSYFRDIDFLFFISLKYCDDEFTIEEMIMKQLIDEKYRDSLYRLLQYEGDKCLVIIDDLNEWTPPRGTPESPITSKGLPLRQLKSGYATIYTTRPWKLATVRPKSGEFDMIIELEGIDQEASVDYINRVIQYLDKMSKRRKDAKDFLVSLEERRITHLKRYPLLSKFLLCLWYDESKLDNTLAGVYRAVIDLIIGQAHRRGTLSHLDKCDDTNEHLCNFMTIYICKEYVEKYFHSVVLPLAVFSFQLCQFKRRVCYVFETTNLNFYGLTEENLKLFTYIGILSQRICYGRSVLERCTTVSFVHDTFQDFFAAVYLSIYPNKISDSCKTADSILRMKPVFLFLSGLNFSALQIIFYRLLSIIDNDENCQNYRCGTSSFPGFVIEMQRLFSNCIEEARRNNISIGSLSLRDAYLGKETNEYVPAVCHIDFGELRSLYCDVKLPLDIQERIVKAQTLDMFVCNNFECCLARDVTAEILRNNESSLKYLKLSGEGLNEIDISGHTFQQLRRLKLSDISLTCQKFANLITNSGCLEEVQLYNVNILDNKDNSSEAISSDSLPYVSSIKTLKLRNCGHVFHLVSLFPSLECLRFEKSSPQLLTEIVSKSTNIMKLTIRTVELGTEGSLAICITKHKHLQLLRLQTISISQFCLSELLGAVGNLPMAVRVLLNDIEIEEKGKFVVNVQRYLENSELYSMKTFNGTETFIINAEIYTIGEKELGTFK